MPGPDGHHRPPVRVDAVSNLISVAVDPCLLRRDRIPHGPHIIDRAGEVDWSCVGLRLTEQEGGPPNDAIMEWEMQDQDETQIERDRNVLVDWWVGLAAEEARRVVPKAVEYGSTDLREIGRTMRDCLNYRGKHTDATDAELGVYFYLVGKMARWTDAIREGRKVSDDTLHDIGVYVRMAQRIRAVGGWPFNPEDGISEPQGEA